MTLASVSHLPDRELLDNAVRVAASERHATVELLTLLGEIDARKLYLSEGCSSLFNFCTRILRFSEHEAYHRIEAARAMRDYPMVAERLKDGALTLTSVTLLRPHLDPDNAEALIANALHKSRREVEQQMAGLAPKPEVKAVVRRLPEPRLRSAPQLLLADERTVAATAAEPDPPLPTRPPRPISIPLAPDRYLLRVTLSADGYAKLQRARDLLRHSIPNGDPAQIVERALTLLVEDLERRRAGSVKKARKQEAQAVLKAPHSRYIPAPVRRQVWIRDEGRCAFVGRMGRCEETGFLEYHHVVAFALGGPTSADNLELRCRSHNQYEGALIFGAR